jgi:hypothetical protein
MGWQGFSAALFTCLVATSAASATPASEDGRSGLAADDAAAPKGEMGYLTVTTVPAAKVEIDGNDTGQTSPITKVPLAAGKHKVTVVSLDGKTRRTLGVTIVAGEEKRLSVNL